MGGVTGTRIKELSVAKIDTKFKIDISIYQTEALTSPLFLILGWESEVETGHDDHEAGTWGHQATVGECVPGQIWLNILERMGRVAQNKIKIEDNTLNQKWERNVFFGHKILLQWWF